MPMTTLPFIAKQRSRPKQGSEQELSKAPEAMAKLFKNYPSQPKK